MYKQHAPWTPALVETKCLANMVSQQLEEKYIEDAKLRGLLVRLFGVGRFCINVYAI